MAITLENFRKALDTKIWNSPVSRTVTVFSAASTATDEYGDEYPTRDAGTESKMVPYNKLSTQRDFLKWGTLNDGETEMAVPYTTTIYRDDLIVDSNTLVSSYEVMDIEPYPYGEGDVATVLRLKEVLSTV